MGIIPLLLIPFLSQYTKKLLLFCLCLFVFLGGGLHFQSSLPKINEHYLQFYNDQGKVEIEGMVVTEPESRDKASVFQLSAQKITIDNKTEQISGKAIVHVPRYSAYHYGDILKLNGTVETPPQFDDFNYRDYLAHQRTYSTMYYPKSALVERNKGSKVLAFIYSLRNSLSQSLSNVLPEPQSSLAQGILLGLRGNIPQSLTQTFSTTGTVHLLAISGLNLTIITGILLYIGIRLFGRRHYLYILLAFAATWFYVVVAGMQPPVIRGAIMGGMFLIAELLGRQRSAATALTFAASVMVGIEPQILWDASFQLSFLSMAGLVFIFPYLQVWNRGKSLAPTNSGGIMAILYTTIIDSFAVTTSAIIATWPVIAYHFGIFSLIALPANFFAIPTLPAIIITAAIIAITGLILPLFAQAMGWIAWLFVSYLIFIVQIFDAVPFSSIRINNIQLWQVLIYYILLVLAIVIIKRRSQFTHFLTSSVLLIGGVPNSISKVAKTYICFPLLVAAILVWTAAFTIPDDKLHVSILNIGQGDAILIQTPNRNKILIDGGPSPQAIKLELSKKLPFWDRQIDLMIATQPQADHISGLVEVLQQYNVKQVITSEATSNSSIYAQMLKTIQDKKITHTKAYAGQGINLGDSVYIEVLHPPPCPLQGTDDDINNNGMVLHLKYKTVSFLFTADIGEEAEWYLISQRANLKSTVLKIAHHGSRSATSPELLAVTDPKVAVISAGRNNTFNHPHPEVLTRLRQRISADKILFTANNGTAEFITDGKRLWVKTEY